MPRKRRSEDIDGCASATSPIKIKIEQFIEENNNNHMSNGEDQDSTAVNQFAEDTSMLGFRYLHTRYKTWFRILWACVLIFFIGLTVYQVFERITYYFIKNPLSTRRTYDTLSNMYFPTIGVCNKMQMKASAVASQNPELLRAMCNVLNDPNSQNSSKFDELDKFNDVDILSIYRNSFQSADDLFVSCEFGKSGSCQDEIRPMYTPNGLCYSVSPNKTILRPGPETTLSLVLNLEVHDIVPGTVFEPGVILSIYDGASSLSHYSEGIHLEAGKIVTIPVNEVRKLQRYETTCGSTKMESFSAQEYSKSACEWSVTVKEIEKACGCIPIRNPIYREIMKDPDWVSGISDNSTTKTGKKNGKKSGKYRKKCTLRQEMECVHEKMNIRPQIDDQICPDDCEEITYSSIVFGGKLNPSEIISLLPSDWEDTKEKRVGEYQKALEVMPNRIIPLVKNVQLLADDLQNFVEEASMIFGSSKNKTMISNEVHCLSHDGKSYESMINQFNAHEPIWERISTYLQQSLARELNITATCLGFNLDALGNLIEFPIPEVNMTLASFSLIQLAEIENSLGRRNFNYRLSMMHESTRRTVLELASPLIKEVKECVTKMYDNLERVEEIAPDCRAIFKNRYTPLLEASFVHTKLHPSTQLIKSYMEGLRKITSRLAFMKSRVKMFDWKNFEIDLKDFEQNYRDGGKDLLEIEEMLKLRKSMVTDIPEIAEELSKIFTSVSKSRKLFSSLTGVTVDDSWNMKFENTSECLRELHEDGPRLKKNRFLRGEWLSRLRNQLQMAQSYSPSHQYDVVNLLHIKFYFAHFKQETIIQEKSYNMFLLLAEIGGTIGLYVGATLLTVAETLVFFFERKTRNIFLKPQYL
ncbi:unnamed protein product [Caenorhabditis angaria]|uniref:Uncharacterized protein n=1 Tax=Caenorhabditis angaria TaxID=860376 RepID=A0A9P1IZM3_9PELO|nr:unnamed protein product [Caenorhabditis angaria]